MEINSETSHILRVGVRTCSYIFGWEPSLQAMGTRFILQSLFTTSYNSLLSCKEYTLSFQTNGFKRTHNLSIHELKNKNKT